MKASECSVETFLKKTGVKFVIPVYQRNYNWKKKQCEQLLSDLIEIGQNKKNIGHFIGSIVYLSPNTVLTSSITELVIIDGQQRLTTLTLIYLALYKHAKKINDVSLAEEIYETCLINKFAPTDEKLKLKTSMNNDKALKSLFSDDESFFDEFSQLIENFQFFQKEIEKNDLDLIRQGLRKLMFVEISLEKNDDPQRIFESLNSTGLELSQADLVRNFILMGLSSKEQDRLYQMFWEYIEQKARDEKNNENKMSEFIRDFLTLKNKDIPNKARVYQEFKTLLESESLVELSVKVENTLDEMKSLVNFYNRIINPNNEPDLEIKQQLRYINKLEINVANPFLMKVYEDYNKEIISKKIFIDILELIQSYAWRRFIVGLPTNTLNKIFMTLYSKIDINNYFGSLCEYISSRTGIQRFPDDCEINGHFSIKDFYNIKPKSSKYFFERLENYQNNEYVSLENNLLITVEHIFPQNPDSEWKRDLGEEETNMLKERLHCIGNLTLSGNNSSLSNKSFQFKRDLAEKGYKDSRLWLNKYLSSCNKFGLIELNERTSKLIDRFFKIWPYPLGLKNSTGHSFAPINQKFLSEDKSINYLIFYDKRVETSDISKLYQTVFKMIYEKRIDLLEDKKLANMIKLTQDGASLSLPILISDKYFIENNFDNFKKVESIEYAMKISGHPDQFVVKYNTSSNISSNV